MKRVLVLADIHANTVALQTVLDAVGPVDLILHAGDIVDYNPWPSEAIAMVNRYGMRSVMGNHDRDAAQDTPIGYNPYAAVACHWTHRQLRTEERNYLLGLPRSLEVNLEGFSIFLCHGSPRDLLDEYVTPDYPREVLGGFLASTQAQILILGHTHIPLLEAFSQDRYLLNPGSVGQPRDGDPKASYALIELRQGEAPLIQHGRVSYDVEAVAVEIRRRGLPAFVAERLYLGL